MIAETRHRLRFHGRGLVAAAAAATLLTTRTQAGEATSREHLQPAVPRYSAALTYGEFSAVHAAADRAYHAHSPTLRVRLAGEGESASWVVEFGDSTQLDAIASRLAEFARVGEAPHTAAAPAGGPDTSRCEAARTALARLRAARFAPLWDVTSAEGELVYRDGAWHVATAGAPVPIRAADPGVRPDALAGRRVLASGVVHTAGVLDVLKLVEVRRGTLDLFVMSLCPFARRAELSVLDRLATMPDSVALDVHYIFYPQGDSAGAPLTSMHGEDEVRENLVQMWIRDHFPDSFRRYLRLRSGSDERWEVLARRAGLLAGDVIRLAQGIAQRRDELAAREYDRVANVWGVRDGSPTFVWESRVVPDLRRVPGFEALVATAESCGAAH